MSQPAKAAGRVLSVLLLIALFSDAGLYLRAREGVARVAASVPVLRAGPASLPPPAGYGLGGRLILPALRPKCWAMRYSAMGCPYCRNDDRGGWAALARSLSHIGCGIYILPPNRHGSYLEGLLVPRSAKQEIYVSMSWIRRFRLGAEPTTVIVGPGGTLAWYDEGELGPRAPASALARLRAVGVR